MKILTVFGTRPEAIKMAPLVKLMAASTHIDSRVCVTAQHRQMLDQPLDLFSIKPDYDLNLMRAEQSLSSISAYIITAIGDVYRDFCPDFILVHGDTSTTFCATLTAYYEKIPVGHVEAGLRTGDLYAPWPEEANRRLTGALAKLHFAPTQAARNNLLCEGIADENIFVTGNTVVDALEIMQRKLETEKGLKETISQSFSFLSSDRRMVLVTGHRRENFGEGFESICNAIARLAAMFPEIDFVYPVHLNPRVSEPVYRILGERTNIHLIEPQDYLAFIYLMGRADIILTDSGGIQEEAPALGKPVVVMREVTERPEAVEAGTAMLVGTDSKRIINAVSSLLVDEVEYRKVSMTRNPFGDGNACRRILEVLLCQTGRDHGEWGSSTKFVTSNN